MSTFNHKNFREAKILISYVTAGDGHRRAAEAIAEAVRQRLPDARVECADLLDWTPRWLRWLYPRLYACLVGCVPWAWAAAYALLDRRWCMKVYRPLRRRWNALMTGSFQRRLRAMQPDVVIATHFFPADVFAAARRAGWLSGRVIVVMTDLFPHWFWILPGADDVVVGSSETRDACRQRGVEESRLHVLGIPIGRVAAELKDRPLIARRLGLDPARKTLLVASGGMGLGPVYRLVKRLLSEEAARPGELQLLVVCGRNDRLARRLNRLAAASAMPVRVFGFVTTMPEMMRVSDLLLTKAGGMTVMEALAMGLPMIFSGVIPGQERFNAEYVVAHGAGIMAAEAEEAVGAAWQVLDDPQRLQAMRVSALALSRPRAAADLVERLVVPDV